MHLSGMPHKIAGACLSSLVSGNQAWEVGYDTMGASPADPIFPGSDPSPRHPLPIIHYCQPCPTAPSPAT